MPLAQLNSRFLDTGRSTGVGLIWLARSDRGRSGGLENPLDRDLWHRPGLATSPALLLDGPNQS
jgi:hypothetical protein